MRFKRVFVGIGALLLVLGVTVGIVAGTGLAVTADIQHGIGVTKGCSSPTAIGQPYSCTYAMINSIDEAHDTLTFDGFSDTVHAAGGNVSSGEIFSQLKYVIGAFTAPFSTPPTCTGGTGTGTAADPFRSAPGNPLISCTLPFGSRLNVQSNSFYTVQPADYNLPGHILSDAFEVIWHDQCNDAAGTGNSNCVLNPPPNGSGSQSIITQLPSSTTTDIHNAAHTVVTSVPVGTPVHDLVTVHGLAGSPSPTGNVSVDWFLNGDCSGAPQANSGSLGPLAPSGGSNSTFDATSFAFTVNTAGLRAFRGHYLGDAAIPTYAPSDGPCEPLNVVDARIFVTPDGVNHIGVQHVLTGHVQVNDGTGWVDAPPGVNITFSINGAAPSLNCNTAAAGSCQVSYTSNVTGVDTISATTTVSVSGNSITRTTGTLINTAAGGGPNATKRWVNARISISPNATNAVGQPHTFTVTLQQDIGDGAGFVALPNQHVDVTLTDAGGAVHTVPIGTCTTAGANTNNSGQCTITFTSNSTGTVTGHASASVSVMGSANFTVATASGAPNSPDAVKTFVNAWIEITPATASNAVGTNHVMTITVHALGGLLDAGTFPATATRVSGPGGFPLPANNTATCNYTVPVGGAASASCTVTLTSTTTGTTVVSATSGIHVAGQTITRTTSTADNTSACAPATCLNASKTWVDAWIEITPVNATNAVGTNHVLTITVHAVGGLLDAGTFPATATRVSGPGGFPLPANNTATCNYTVPAGGAATASCTVTLTSATTGTTVVSATSAIHVGGQTITQTTNTPANNTSAGATIPNASKTWVDAWIEITPVTATNAVGTNHVLTITVHAVNGLLDAGTFPATATRVSGPGGFPLPANNTATCNYTVPAGGAASASCTVTLTSTTTGTTVVSASSAIHVAGQTITQTTNTPANNTSAGATIPNASKTWVDAWIEITPATASNPIGTNHVMTITVHAVNGLLDAGTFSATATKVSGPGGFPPPNNSASCNYTVPVGGAASASCTVTLTSPTTGTTVVSATSGIHVAGQTITRTTSTSDNTSACAPATCLNASKTWVDAWIEITPVNATNAVGTNHVLTITVHAVGGLLDAGTFPATATRLSGPGGFPLPANNTATCNYTVPAGGAASASCTVTLTSATTGTTVVSATSAIHVGGQTITQTTNTPANNTSAGATIPNASKTWVDAWIEITPVTATNAVGTNHVLTITVHAVNGLLDAGTFPATATRVSGPGGFPLPANNTATCNYTVPAGGAASASCTVTLTSTTTGTTVVSASSAIHVAGQTITQTTNTPANNTSAGATIPNASKVWVDGWIEITPVTATNAVGTNHVLTITVHAVNGLLDAGTFPATATRVSGPGGFPLPANNTATCNYTVPAGGAASASCTVTLTSTTTGTTVVSATSAIHVAGQTVTQTTNTPANSTSAGATIPNASKTWVDAWIEITPVTDTNGVGTNHVLTITVHAVNGLLDAGTFPATATRVSGPGGFPLPANNTATCNYTVPAGGAASASCTVTLTSTTTGTTVVSATSAIHVAGQTVTQTTNTPANSTSAGATIPNASKKWVDAWIEITPATDTNGVGTNHVLTITVHAVNGLLDAGTFPATATRVSGPGGFPLPANNTATCNYTVPAGGAATASCTVTLTSTTTGTTVVSATPTSTSKARRSAAPRRPPTTRRRVARRPASTRARSGSMRGSRSTRRRRSTRWARTTCSRSPSTA